MVYNIIMILFLFCSTLPINHYKCQLVFVFPWENLKSEDNKYLQYRIKDVSGYLYVRYKSMYKEILNIAFWAT